MRVRAGKSKNIYKINPSNYHKNLRNKITDTYKIGHNDTISQINDEEEKDIYIYILIYIYKILFNPVNPE